MKKFTALLLCLVLVFALCACGKDTVKVEETPNPEIADKTDENAAPENSAEAAENDQPEESGKPEASKAPEKEDAGMANPCTEYKSLDKINSVVGGNLVSPGVMGVTDNAYAVIDCGNYKIAEYQFTVAGYDYTFRCAKANEDISGVYMNGGTAFEGKAGEQHEIGDNVIIYGANTPAGETNSNGMQFNSDNEYKCARWFVDDLQYVLTVNDKGEMEHDTFDGIADELMQMTLTYSS